MLALIIATVLVLFVAYWPQPAIAVWLVLIIFTPSWTVLVLGNTHLSPPYLAIPVVLGLGVRALGTCVKGGGLPRVTITDAIFGCGVILVVACQRIYGQESFLSPMSLSH